MTQYMLAVHGVGDQPNYASDEEMQAAFKAVDEFNQKLMGNGSWVFGGGLEPPETATTLRITDGAAVVTDGPFAETKEQLLGFYVLDVESLDEALAIARELGEANPGGSYEIRPVALYFGDEREALPEVVPG